MIEMVEELRITCKYYRKIRGDGNCYYRSVAYHILEKMLLHKGIAKEIQIWLNNQVTIPTSFFYNFDTNIIKFSQGYTKVINITPSMKIINQLLDKVCEWSELEEKSMAIDNLIAILNEEDNAFDKVFILLLRYGMMNMLIRYAYIQEFKINGKPLNYSLQVDMVNYKNDLGAIILNELMVMGKDARDWMIELLPSLIGSKVTVCFLKADEKSYKEITFIPFLYEEDNMLHKAFREENFYILLKPGHYDMLYSHKEIKAYKCLDNVGIK